MSFQFGLNIPGIGNVGFVSGRSRRRSNSRAFRAQANTNAQAAQYLAGRVQQLEQQLMFERMRNCQSGFPGMQINNYNFGNQMQSFGNGFLNDPSALMQQGTLGATSSILSSANGMQLAQAAQCFGQSPACCGSGRFNLYQMFAYQQARGLYS